MEQEITRISRNFPAQLNNNLVIFSNSALEKIKQVDSITIYEPRYNYIVGLNDLKEKSKFLKQAFQSNMFNLLHYINDRSDKFSSWAAYIETGNDLERCLLQIQEDIENNFIPAKYAVSHTYNVSQIRRWKLIS